MAGVKKKSQRQVRFLLSKASPLTKSEKDRLKRELKSGEVKIVKKKKAKKKARRS